jgi:hypothetical protein
LAQGKAGKADRHTWWKGVKDEIGVPAGYAASHWFAWTNREKDGIELVVFINPADDHGVCISNLAKGDRVRITSISGNCRFSRGDGVKKILSFLGVAGPIVAGVVDPKTAPLTQPIIKELIGWAEKNLLVSPTGILRDGYGWDGGGPMNFCYNEGGVIVCLPEAGGPLYGGGGDAAIRRPKKGDQTPRYDEFLPKHVKGKGFFPVRGDQKHNTRVIGQPGELFILAWDGPDDFDDNTGHYVLRLQIVKEGKKFPGE